MSGSIWIFSFISQFAKYFGIIHIDHQQTFKFFNNQKMLTSI